MKFNERSKDKFVGYTFTYEIKGLKEQTKHAALTSLIQ